MKRFRNIHKKTHVLKSLLNKERLYGLQIYEKETPTQMFSCKYWEIYKKPILKNISVRLPLKRL